jgi:2-polyprenyl-3-methyl-5-hydroxy-6-metoxy-1,4-benzoquinol methylase
VLSSELISPNSTTDAKRIMATLSRLEAGTDKGDRSFLDVGCGYGFFSKAAVDAGYEVKAIELARNEREIAKKNAGVEATPSSFEDFSHSKNFFDVVLMSQILEHALDVNQWIEKAHSLLREGGVIVIALPNFDSIFRRVMQENEPYICPPAHLNFFNPTSLAKLLKNHGFRVEETQWVSRLPTTSFENRLPGFIKPALPLVAAVSNATLKSMDKMHLGMIINVYARKI